MGTMTPRISNIIHPGAAANDILRRILAGAIDARQRQADRQVNALLLSLDEGTLATFGCIRTGLHDSTGGPLPL
jgi:hypothetical protein